MEDFLTIFHQNFDRKSNLQEFSIKTLSHHVVFPLVRNANYETWSFWHFEAYYRLLIIGSWMRSSFVRIWTKHFHPIILTPHLNPTIRQPIPKKNSQNLSKNISRKTGYGGSSSGLEGPWDSKPSKIQTFFQLSVTALAFLAFAGYLLCMIVQAIKAKGMYMCKYLKSHWIRN